MDFDKEKKEIIDFWHLGVNSAGTFLIGFTIGKENVAYATYPAGAKLLHETLGKVIDQFEKEHGTIDTSTATVSKVSPFQPKNK